MCGILAVVKQRTATDNRTAPIARALRTVRHRGPDDEGYLLWKPGEAAQVYAGDDTAHSSEVAHRLAALPPSADWTVALGHRRLSIVDLSPGGHQPMIHRPTGMAVTFNGEIYNYLELRAELARLGHTFTSHSDTEVLLAAWAQWGPDALQRFNGMFAFALLDPREGGRLHVVRDRFGVKPVYWSRVGHLIAFASEIKQIRALPGFTPRLDHGTARDYLAVGRLDHSRHTFDAGIEQLRGGERLVVDLGDPARPIQRIQWYELRPASFRGGLGDAAARFRDLLADSVRLRLRADVPVGSCLSGGLDSSAIVCLAHAALSAHGNHAGQITVTARFQDDQYDEWGFAQEVVQQTGARSVQVWPSTDRLRAELDAMLWHMDEPFGSTSQFSQWCVFAGAAAAGLKVMLDGQGSDEQLAGYAGNDAALYAGLLRRGAVWALVREVGAFRSRHEAFPIAQLILAVRNVAPFVDRLLPARVRLAAPNPDWLRLSDATHIAASGPRGLNTNLMEQTLVTSLPVLLRYEDRNSMARSIEARVPFLDYRLVEFLAGLPDTYKLREGVTKLVMREGLHGVLPERIRDRRDKMGFVTPEKVWLTKTDTPWFRDAARSAVEAAPELFHPDRVVQLMDDVIAGRAAFSFTPWRIVCFGRWVRQQAEGHPLDPLPPPGALHAPSNAGQGALM
jgi:asparagine synthase (glutamine-hydrolysing)